NAAEGRLAGFLANLNFALPDRIAPAKAGDDAHEFARMLRTHDDVAASESSFTLLERTRVLTLPKALGRVPLAWGEGEQVVRPSRRTRMALRHLYDFLRGWSGR